MLPFHTDNRSEEVNCLSNFITLMKLLRRRFRELRQFSLKNLRGSVLGFNGAFKPDGSKSSLRITAQYVANMILI